MRLCMWTGLSAVGCLIDMQWTNDYDRHIKYTIPPAILLTLLYRPLFTKLDAYKVCFLITVRTPSNVVSMFLTLTDCCCFYNTVGLVLDPQSHLELSKPCHYWPEAIRHPA